MTKLAIIEEREEDKYEHVLTLRHYRNGAAAATALDSSAAISVPAEGIVRADEHVRTLVDGVMKSLSSARQEEVQAWEEEILPCEHTFTLFQLTTGHIPASGACGPPLSLFLQLRLTSGGIRRPRVGTLLKMRPQGEPLALSHLRRARLRTQALRCRRWERPRARAF